MAHSFVCSSYYHIIFSTKDRRPTIHDDFRERLWPYIGGIARDNKTKALAVGGIADHCHALLSLPSTMTIAKAVQLIKGSSSKWVHEKFPKYREFAWQEGYGAFSIGVSQIPTTIRYIHSQEEHHRQRSFEDEFLAILAKHDVEYDPRFVWG